MNQNNIRWEIVGDNALLRKVLTYLTIAYFVPTVE